MVFLRFKLLFFYFFVSKFLLLGQQIKEPRQVAEWTKHMDPFRIVGNLYYVGTYDLGCYLIATSKGNILINTGVQSSGPEIKHNIESLGLKLKDIKILLTTQAHYDHVGAMAYIKRNTHARLLVDAADAQVLKDGGKSDYEMSKYGATFEPVNPDQLLQDSNKIILGDMSLTLLHHPGHTKGSCSYLLNVQDGLKKYSVLIANMPSIVTDRKFSSITDYPSIEKDYAYTLTGLKNIHFDIWLASHAGQFDLHEKYKSGQPYNPSVFNDANGFANKLSELQRAFDEKLKADKIKS